MLQQNVPVSTPHEGQQRRAGMQDILIDELGGPSKVAEMSGRRKRMIRNPNGAGFVYRLVAEEGVPLDQVHPDLLSQVPEDPVGSLLPEHPTRFA